MGKSDFIKSENRRLNQQLLFTAEIDKMTDVMRQTLLINKSRQENDAEHSWHIAVMAMLFSEYAIEPVNIGRVVQMCVVHDIVEIEAGDTFAYDAQGNVDKAEREKEAADKLFAKLPADQGKMIRELWEEFEAYETPEAKYAHTLDNFQPIMLNDATDGRAWREHVVKKSQVLKRNRKTAEGSEVIMEQIEGIVEKHIKNGNLINA